MKILIACEYSGRVRDAFIAKGHDAVSCDLLPTERSGPHYRGDVRDIVGDGWDMMIAHPPCTYIANSGVQHLRKSVDRWYDLHDAVLFFQKLLNAKCPKIAVENPIPHGYARLPKYTQIIQPWWFGEEVQKSTCLWLKGLPLLVPSNIVGKGEQYIGKDGKPNGSQWYQLAVAGSAKLRSLTFQGIADAMADQWGNDSSPI